MRVIRRSALALIAAGALWAPGPARALSFSIGPGDVIVDVDFSSGSQTLTYDGTSESITLTAQADRLILASGSTIALDGPGQQVVFSMTVALVPGTLFIDSDLFGSGGISGVYQDGVAADFTLVDVLDAGGPTLLAAADFSSGLDLSITGFFGVMTGGLGGTYAVAGGDPIFLGAFGNSGSLAVNFSQLERGGVLLQTICDVADAPCVPPIAFGTPWPGLQDFSAQPGVDLTPAPEPALGALLGLGLALVAAGRRLRP